MNRHPLNPITASVLALGAQNREQAAAGQRLEDGLGGLAPTSELALGAQNRGQAASGKRLEMGPKGGPQVGSVLEAPASR